MSSSSNLVRGKLRRGRGAILLKPKKPPGEVLLARLEQLDAFLQDIVVGLDRRCRKKASLNNDCRELKYWFRDNSTAKFAHL